MDVRLPDGTIIRNVPEGTSREQVFEVAKQRGLDVDRPERGSYWDAIAQGLTFGWSDELAGLGAMIGSKLYGRPWEAAGRAADLETQRRRESLRQVREQDPFGVAAMEIGGALASGGPALKGAMALGRMAGLGSGASLAAGGTGEGIIAGAGAGDENRLLGAAVGGGLGLGASAAIPAAVYGARRGVEALQPLRQRLTEEPTTTASRVISESMEAGGMTPALLRARQRQLGPEASFVDVAGPAGTGLGQGIIQADPTSQAITMARREMGRRAAGSTRRLREDIAETTGVTERLQPSLDAVRARQKELADPAYAQAYAHDISMTPKLKNLLSRPPMRKAFDEAKEAAATRGEELPPFMQMDEFGQWQQEGVMPDMRAWDQMKQGIDRLIEKEIDPVTGRMTRRGADLTQMKNELLSELDEINPDYARARQVFAGDEAIQNAMRSGEKFLNMKTREVRQAVDNLKTNSERESFLSGAVEAIREKMGRARAGEIGEFRFLETGNAREKLRALFPEGRQGDQQAAQLLRTLNRERTLAQTQGLIIGNSQTAQRQAAGRAVETGVAIPTSTEILTSPSAMAQAALESSRRALSQISDRSIQELAQLLFQPGNVETVITEMQRRGIPQRQITEFVNRYSRGTAALSPGLGIIGASSVAGP